MRKQILFIGNSYTKSNPLAELYLREQHHLSLLGGTIAARTILAGMRSAG